MRVYFFIIIFTITNIAFSFDASNNILLSKQNSLFNHSEVISNNVANTDTPGFKSKRIIENTYIDANKSVDPSAYNNDFATYTDMQEGSLMQTGNTFDLAISGAGFFSINTTKGIFYSRTGFFTINKNYEIVTQNGGKLLDNGKGIITLPENYSNVIIKQDGIISVNNEEIARVGIVKFTNLNKLKNIGSNLFTAEETPIIADDKDYRILQGFIEQSNVNKVKQLTNLIEIQRDMGIVTNLLNNYDDLAKTTLSKLGRY